MMTEKEKMLNGELYNSRDPELLKMYHKARRILKEFNNLDSEKIDQKNQLLTELFDFKGKEVWIEAPFFCDFGENISIGENTFVNFNCVFLDCNKISIGKNGLIAPNVQILTANHPVSAKERIFKNKNGETTYHTCSERITIGDQVWIGACAIICPGVNIGDNVTIGAGSVVTNDIPSDVLAFGNPCRVVRTI